MNYTLGKIKTFRGRDGYGLNATILLDGKPVAFVLDEGCGGMLDVDFTNPGQNAKSWEQNHDFAAEREQAFHQFALGWYAANGQREKRRAQFAEWGMTQESIDAMAEATGHDAAECWINEQVQAWELKRALDRSAKKATLFRIKGEEYRSGEYRTVKRPYDASVQEFLDRKYPGQVTEIYGVTA